MATKKPTTKSAKSAKATEETVEVEKKKDTGKKSFIVRHKFIILTVVVALAGLAYLAYTHKSYVVAATVNGQPIYRHTLLLTTEQVHGPMVLEQLINEQVVAQEASKRGLVVTQEDLDTEFQNLKDRYQKEQGVDLESVMQQNGVTRQEVQKNLTPQALQNKLITSEGLVATDDEVDAFFVANPTLLPEDAKEAATARENLKQSLKDQKVQGFLQGLRAKAKINYYIGK